MRGYIPILVLGAIMFGSATRSDAGHCIVQHCAARSSVSLEQGSVRDLRGAQRVFVFTGGDAATFTVLADAIADLSLELVASAEEADVVLLLAHESLATEPGFGVPPEYRQGHAAGTSGQDTAAILVRAGRDHYKVVYSEQIDPTHRLAVARSLAERFRQALTQVRS